MKNDGIETPGTKVNVWQQIAIPKCVLYTLWPHASRTRAYAALSQGACDIMFIKQLAEEDFGLK